MDTASDARINADSRIDLLWVGWATIVACFDYITKEATSDELFISSATVSYVTVPIEAGEERYFPVLHPSSRFFHWLDAGGRRKTVWEAADKYDTHFSSATGELR